MHERVVKGKGGRRRSTLTLKVGGQKLTVTTHAQMVRRQLRMANNRERRHSFTFGIKPAVPMVMLHELRQFYDVSYR